MLRRCYFFRGGAAAASHADHGHGHTSTTHKSGHDDHHGEHHDDHGHHDSHGHHDDHGAHGHGGHGHKGLPIAKHGQTFQEQGVKISSTSTVRPWFYTDPKVRKWNGWPGWDGGIPAQNGPVHHGLFGGMLFVWYWFWHRDAVSTK